MKYFCHEQVLPSLNLFCKKLNFDSTLTIRNIIEELFNDIYEEEDFESLEKLIISINLAASSSFIDAFDFYKTTNEIFHMDFRCDSILNELESIAKSFLNADYYSDFGDPDLLNDVINYFILLDKELKKPSNECNMVTPSLDHWCNHIFKPIVYGTFDPLNSRVGEFEFLNFKKGFLKKEKVNLRKSYLEPVFLGDFLVFESERKISVPNYLKNNKFIMKGFQERSLR